MKIASTLSFVVDRSSEPVAAGAKAKRARTERVDGAPEGRFVVLPGRGKTYVYELSGPANAPTVMLLHGWTATAALNFSRLLVPLSEEYHVLAMDMRGHGRGIRPRPFFRLEDCADDAIALADVLGIDQIIPVGYSMGGTVAQLIARREPSRVRGVVLCATAKTFRSQGRDRFLWEGSMGIAATMLTFAPNGVRQQILDRFVLVRAKPETPPWMVDEIKRNDPAIVVQAGLALGRFDATDWIGTLGREGSSGIPASVVITTKDTTVATPRQRALAKAMTGATAHEVDAGHRAAVTESDLFMRALMDALRDVTK